MNNKLFNLVVFAAGAGLGYFVADKLLKTKYEQIAREEIESVKEVFAIREESFKKQEEVFADYISNGEDTKHSRNQKPDLMEYAAKIEEEGYSSEEEDDEVQGNEKEAPYVISPDEFGEIDGYESVTLYYYEDGILANEYDEEIEDVEGTVGEDSLDTFGQYEDDTVYVRNNENQTDYEICKCLSNFSDF